MARSEPRVVPRPERSWRRRARQAGLSVVITPVVTWVPDPNLTNGRDYKKLSLTVVVTKPGLRIVYVHRLDLRA